MALIIADTREDNGANPYLESSIAENNKKNCKLSFNAGGGDISFKIKQITVGDYCILVRDKTNPKKTILAMIIERKTWKDLSASIKDERINHQHKNLHEIHQKKGCHVLYIIEGNMTYKDDFKVSNIPFKNLHAKMRHNTIRGVPFIQTKDEQHTSKMIVDFARDMLKLYRQGEIEFVKQNIQENDDVAIYKELKTDNISLLRQYTDEINEINKKYKKMFLANKAIPNIINEVDKIIQDAQNPQTIVQEPFHLDMDLVKSAVDGDSENPVQTAINMSIINSMDTEFTIPDEIRTNRIYDDSDITLSIWNSFPNVSAKSAILIQNKFHISDVICANGDDVERIKKEIADLKFSSGMKFGNAKATKIMDISYNGDDTLKKERVYELSIGVISKIPGLSDVAAKAILEHYSLRDICNGFVQADMISEIKPMKNNSHRKISLKSSEKLVQLLLKPSIANLYPESGIL